MLTVGEGDGSGEEDDESVPVCSVGREASTDDVCADAAVAPLHDKPRRDSSPSQVSFVTMATPLMQFMIMFLVIRPQSNWKLSSINSSLIT